MLTRDLISIEAGRDPGDSRPADPLIGEFARDLAVALASRPRSISPKYFYDAQGSQLFDRICELPEYYPTRTELGILAQNAREIAAQIGPACRDRGVRRRVAAQGAACCSMR